jgi:hypothetical protein
VSANFYSGQDKVSIYPFIAGDEKHKNSTLCMLSSRSNPGTPQPTLRGLERVANPILAYSAIQSSDQWGCNLKPEATTIDDILLDAGVEEVNIVKMAVMGFEVFLSQTLSPLHY